LRNTRVIDVVRELKEFGCSVDVSDPWVSSEDVEREYGIALVKAAPKGDYDALILAVPRNTQAIAFSYARSVRGTVNSCLIGRSQCMATNHHDTGYKELFSYPEFVQQLVESLSVQWHLPFPESPPGTHCRVAVLLWACTYRSFQECDHRFEPRYNVAF